MIKKMCLGKWIGLPNLENLGGASPSKFGGCQLKKKSPCMYRTLAPSTNDDRPDVWKAQQPDVWRTMNERRAHFEGTYLLLRYNYVQLRALASC